MSRFDFLNSLDPVVGIAGLLLGILTVTITFLSYAKGDRILRNSLFEVYVSLIAVKKVIKEFKEHTLESTFDSSKKRIDEREYKILQSTSAKCLDLPSHEGPYYFQKISATVGLLLGNVQRELLYKQYELICSELDSSQYVSFIDKTILEIDDLNKLIKKKLPLGRRINLKRRLKRKIDKDYRDLIRSIELNQAKKMIGLKNQTLLENESRELEEERESVTKRTLHSVNDENISTLNTLHDQINQQHKKIEATKDELGKPTYVAQIVKVILEATGHQILQDQDFVYSSKNEDIDLNTTAHGRMHWVRCTVEPVSEESLLEFQQEHPFDDDTEYLIICDNIIEPSAAKLKEQLPNLEIKTISEFLRTQFYLKRYLDWLDSSFNKQEIRKHNIDLRVVEQTESQGKRKIPGYSKAIQLKSYLNQWLQSGNSNRHYTILGDYGTGKSWFCWYYAMSQLDEYKRNPVGSRLPILIHLRDYKNFNTWEDIFELFCERFNITKLSFEVFKELNARGRFLIIFDGFDELFSGPTNQTAIEKFYQLNRAAQPESKVLLTSRTTFFRNIDEKVSDGLTKEERVNLQVHPNFKKLIIEPLEDHEIKNYLKVKDPENWQGSYKKIAAHSNLLDLAKRPILLQMISITLPDLIGKEDINVFDLYQKYTERWINEAGIGRTQNLLNPSERYELMKNVAWEMYTKGKLIIETSKLDMILSKLLPDDSWIQAKDYLEEIKGQTFLITNDKDTYSIAHKSFLEFFVSIVLADKINAFDKNVLQNIGKPIEKEILDFVAHCDLEVEILVKWLSEKKPGESNGVFNGNVVNLLKSKKYVFKGYDFSDMHLQHPDFSNCDLTGANFQNATLSQFDARDAILDDCDFTNARFKSLILGVRSATKYVANSLRFIAAPNGSNEIELYHASLNGESKIILEGHGDSITNLAFNTPGDRLASTGFDRNVIVWDVENRKELLRLKGHQDTVYALCFSRDSSYIISGDNSHVLKFWDTKKGKELMSIDQGHTKTIYSIDHHPTQDLVATGSFDETIGIWTASRDGDTLNVDLLTKLRKHSKLVNHIAFSPDGKLLASASNDKTVILWQIDPETLIPEYRATIEGHNEVVWSVAFSPDSKYLASGGSDSMIRVWDISTPEQPKRVDVLSGHKAEVWTLVFSKDGKHIISGSFDSTLKIWDWKNPEKKLLKTYAMVKDGNSRFSCKDMLISDSPKSELSKLQINFLTDGGAIINEHRD